MRGELWGRMKKNVWDKVEALESVGTLMKGVVDMVQGGVVLNIENGQRAWT